jgi:hypothetical protein
MHRLNGLATRLDHLFHPEHARRHKEREAIKRVLRKLRRQQRRLEAEHASTLDPTRRDRLQTAIAIARAQRLKGIRLLRRG